MKRIKLTEAAKMLGINEWTLRRWVYAGKVPVIRSDSGRVFVPEWWLKRKRSLPPGSAGILPASWGCGHPGRRAGETPALPGG
jgi:hypothetical protein